MTLLERLTELNERATKGEWRVVLSSRGGDYIETFGVDEYGDAITIKCPGTGGAMSISNQLCQMTWRGTPEWTANADLIAESKNALPALLEAVRCLEIARAFVQLTYDESSGEEAAEAKRDLNKIDAALAPFMEGK